MCCWLNRSMLLIFERESTMHRAIKRILPYLGLGGCFDYEAEL